MRHIAGRTLRSRLFKYKKIMAKTLNSRIPEGPVAEKWTNYKAHQRLVNPKNKLKLDVIVVGTGLAGASAAASLGEMGFNV